MSAIDQTTQLDNQPSQLDSQPNQPGVADLSPDSQQAAPAKKPRAKRAAAAKQPKAAKSAAAKAPATAKPKRAARAKKSDATGKPTEKKTRSKPVDEKQAKPKRISKVEPSVLEISGICVGPARVKNILADKALNVSESLARDEIRKLAGRTVGDLMIKPRPLSSLPAEYAELLAKAESQHLDSLHTAYVNHKMKKLAEADQSSLASLAKFKSEYKGTPANLAELKQLYSSYAADFYNGYDEFVAANDKLKVSAEMSEYNRAIALINKCRVRISKNTRFQIASYLDRLITDYIKCAVRSCVLRKKVSIRLEDFYSVHRPENFTFMYSLKAYHETFEWIKRRNEALEANKEAADKKKLEYTLRDVDEFSGYTTELFRYVKNVMSADSTECTALAAKLNERTLNGGVPSKEHVDIVRKLILTLQNSREAKRFCSYLIYDAICRIGKSLKETVDYEGVKTVSDSMVMHVLRLLHTSHGVDFSKMEAHIQSSLLKFSEVSKKKRSARGPRQPGRSKAASADAPTDASNLSTSAAAVDKKAAAQAKTQPVTAQPVTQPTATKTSTAANIAAANAAAANAAAANIAAISDVPVNGKHPVKKATRRAAVVEEDAEEEVA